MARGFNHFQGKDPRFFSLVFPTCVPTTLALDSNQTLTTDQVLCGFLLRSIGAARTDTLPTAAKLVDAIQGVMVGTFFDTEIQNNSSGNFLLTVNVGTGGTAVGIMTVAQKAAGRFRVVFTNVTLGLEAFTVYRMSTSTVLA